MKILYWQLAFLFAQIVVLVSCVRLLRRANGLVEEADAQCRRASVHQLPPPGVSSLSRAAIAELESIAMRDGVSVSTAAARILEECLTDDAGGHGGHGGDPRGAA